MHCVSLQEDKLFCQVSAVDVIAVYNYYYFFLIVRVYLHNLLDLIVIFYKMKKVICFLTAIDMRKD